MQQIVDDIREFQNKIAQVKEGSFDELNPQDYVNRVFLRQSLINEENQEMLKAMLTRDKVEILDAGVDLIYVTVGLLQEAGVIDKLPEAWRLVHENNLSKLDENGNVVKNANGKIIKPANYKPVNLKQLF